MNAWTLSERLATTLASLALVSSVACGACGGSKPPATPEGTSTAAGPVDPSAAGTTTPDVDPSKGTGPATTTTGTSASALPDGGELQGSKLSTSSKSVIETKGESGPKAPAGGSQEPGRRREDIQTIVLARRDEARKCYDDGVKGRPGIEGDLVISWKIDPKGNPSDVVVDTAKSQIHETSIGNCIVEIIKKIKFAESAKGFETRTSYPFNFRPRGPQPAGTPAKK